MRAHTITHQDDINPCLILHAGGGIIVAGQHGDLLPGLFLGVNECQIFFRRMAVMFVVAHDLHPKPSFLRLFLGTSGG